MLIAIMLVACSQRIRKNQFFNFEDETTKRKRRIEEEREALNPLIAWKMIYFPKDYTFFHICFEILQQFIKEKKVQLNDTT